MILFITIIIILIICYLTKFKQPSSTAGLLPVVNNILSGSSHTLPAPSVFFPDLLHSLFESRNTSAMVMQQHHEMVVEDNNNKNNEDNHNQEVDVSNELTKENLTLEEECLNANQQLQVKLFFFPYLQVLVFNQDSSFRFFIFESVIFFSRLR